MNIEYINNINKTDTQKVLLLIEASLQAYNSFNKKQPTTCQKDSICPPSNDYKFIECWSGIDSLFNHDKTPEIYGVVFRSHAAPYKYIFAFRGTASIFDIIDDLGVEPATFKAYDKNIIIPKDVEVESGFFDIYTEYSKDTQAMQKQLFALIDKYQSSDAPIDELYITGHSLGSSISEIFTLDVALSRPEIKASNINFACPRTGNKQFVQFYDSQKAQKNKQTQTLRVQNTYDKVPCVPMENLGYQHTNYALLIAFYRDDLVGPLDLLAAHSALNYQAVLKCAASGNDGHCDNHKLKVPGNGKHYYVTSKLADKKTVCSYW
jgi:hypothetical protein